jgi:hypothetical protein
MRLSNSDNSTCVCIPVYSSSSPDDVTCDINVCTAAGLVVDVSSNNDTCECLNDRYTHTGINGITSVTCVLNCVDVNTISLSAQGGICECKSGWKGDLCQIRIVTSSMFSTGEIVGISIGSVFVVGSLIGVLWWLLHTTAVK